MKKRIVSLFLVIAMVVAVIPIIAIPTASANDYTDGYDTTVTPDVLTVDGLCDDAYLRSEKIVSNYKSATNEDNDFVAYTAANAQGLYVWVAVEDTTLAHRNDRLAVYFNFRAVHTNDGTDTITDSYMVVQLRPLDATPFTASGCLGIGDIQTALVKAEGVGYSAEYFIPWQKIADKVGAKGTSALPCSVGFEAQDYNADGVRFSYSGDTNKVGTYYSKVYTFNKLNYVMEEDTPEFKIAGSKDRMGAYSSTALTVDGAMDAVYANGTKITFDAIGSEKDANDYAYVAFTDSDIYVYINMNDTTNDASKDFIQVYHRFHTRLSANGLYYTSGYYRFARDNSTATNNHFNGHIPADLDLKGMGAIEYKIVDNPGVGYTVEIKYPMTAAEKELVNNTSTGMNFDLCFEAHNNSTYNSDSAAGSWVRAYMSSQIMPSIHLVKDVASYAVESNIVGANVALGESISVNCYATLSPLNADAQMRVTFNDKVYIYNARKTSVKNQYVFTLEDIPPQCIGDNIKAELLVDGKAVKTVDNYSVLANCQNLLAEKTTTDTTKQLIYDFLAYGAAAQNYARYKTDALVNKGYETLATTVTSIENNDRKVSPATIAGAKFSAAGVYYAGVNKVYAKLNVTTADVSKLKATVNGVEAKIEPYKDGSYIIYSEAIKVSKFDNVYTFVVHDGVDSQTLVYSINAYAKAKMGASNSATSALAKATYAYGQSAKAYVESIGKINNLYDKSKAFAGYVSGDSEKPSSANYTTDFISVTAGEKIYFGPCKVSQDFQLQAYDASKKCTHSLVGYKDKSVFTVEATFNNGYVIYSYIVPAGASYLRFCNVPAYNDVYVVSRDVITLDNFKEYWGQGNTLDLYPKVNLYDKSKAFAGYVSGTSSTASSIHFSSDYISVTAGEKLYFGPCDVAQQYELQGYDSGKGLTHKIVGYGDKSMFTVEATFDNGFVIYSYVVPSGVAYIRFVNAAKYNDVYMVSRERITLDSFKAYWGEGNTLDLYSPEYKINNLFDKSAVFAGYVSGNSEKPSSANKTSHYISVFPGEKIYFGPCKVSQDFQLQAYDSSKQCTHNLVGYKDTSVFTVEATFDNGYVIYSYVVPADSSYLRFCNVPTYNDIYTVSREPITLKNFKEYWGAANVLDLYSLYPKYTSSAFTGKSTLFLGDSICAANCESGKTYQGWSGRIQIATGMTCTNKGVSGASISTSRGENVVYNHYSTVRNNSYDFIIMHGGVNDAWDNVSVGTMTDSFDPADFDVTTYAGGLENLFYYVTTEHPNAKLGYIFNFATPSFTTGNIEDMSAYYAEAKKICEKWNIPYLNMYEDSNLTAELKVNTKEHLSDLLHPDTSGYDILYTYIMYWMEKLPVYSTVTDSFDLETLPSEVAK